MYFRYNDSTHSWDPPRYLTDDVKATYPQVSIVDETLVLLVNYASFAVALESTDGGDTFLFTALLTHSGIESDSSVSYTNPRIESPGTSFRPLPVLQQYVDGSTQRLMYFAVPVSR
jgi:hypothetical protein